MNHFIFKFVIIDPKCCKHTFWQFDSDNVFVFATVNFQYFWQLFQKKSWERPPFPNFSEKVGKIQSQHFLATFSELFGNFFSVWEGCKTTCYGNRTPSSEFGITGYFCELGVRDMGFREGHAMENILPVPSPELKWFTGYNFFFLKQKN